MTDTPPKTIRESMDIEIMLFARHASEEIDLPLGIARLAKDLGAIMQGDPFSPGNRAYLLVASRALYLYKFGTRPDTVKVTNALCRAGAIAEETIDQRSTEEGTRK